MARRDLGGVEKKARREHRTPVFVDESGFYLLPGVVRTYAPRATTPVLRPFKTRDHLSVMSGITPRGELYTLTRRRALTSVESIRFLGHMHRVVGGKLLVMWDGSPIHRSHEIKTFWQQAGRSSCSWRGCPPTRLTSTQMKACGNISSTLKCEICVALT